MNIKELLLGNGIKGAEYNSKSEGGIQQWLPIRTIVNGVIVTKDRRFIKVLEVLPLNFHLKPDFEKSNIIANYAAFLKIAPANLQVQVITQKVDMHDYIQRMEGYAKEEVVEKCRDMIMDNVEEVTDLAQDEAITHRFFIIFQHELYMKPKQMTVKSIADRMAEEADTLRRYLDYCGLETLEPKYSDNALLDLLYGAICKETSRRVKLPLGVFDMMTTVHGVYED